MGHYRKTNRRQGRHPPWSPRPHKGRTIVWPAHPTGDLVATFLLPGQLSLVAPGRHSLAIAVTPAGLLQIAGRSREHVIRLAAEFFATVARDPMPFAVAAVVGDRARPGEHDVYQLTVVVGHAIAARCSMLPAIIAPASLPEGGR